MKFVILVCSLVVLLSCNEAQCNIGRPHVIGNCQLEDLPESDRTRCVNVRCNKDESGQISFSGMLPCPLGLCSNGPARWSKPDITKEHPDCCPQLICD